MKTKILMIYTGGTIGMIRDYNSQSLKPFDFENLLNHIPELSQIESDISFRSFKKPIDSSDMSPEHWVQIAQMIEENYYDFDGFVILHGTDTMAYSASALSFMLSGLQKPIIFTGSQLPVGDLRTDAKENLITSLHFASLRDEDGAAIKEVCIYFEYKLLRANRTTKISAENFDAFASPDYPYLGESGIRLLLRKNLLFSENIGIPFSVNTKYGNNLGLMKIYPGMSREFITSIINTPGMKALIIESFGSGNVFSYDWFKDLLRTKAKEGLRIIITTQCSGGMVVLGQYETSEIFTEIGAISGYDLTTEAAVTKAIHLLGQSLTDLEFKEHYERNLKGELSHFKEY